MSNKTSFSFLAKVLIYFGLLAFPIGMLFIGFFTIEVSCLRAQAGQKPDCEIREIRLFGLYNNKTLVTEVVNIGYKTGYTRSSARLIAGSTVVLMGSNGTYPVTRTMSNVGDTWKSGLINKIDQFLKMQEEQSFSLFFHERNIFGWVGLAFLTIMTLFHIYLVIRKI